MIEYLIYIIIGLLFLFVGVTGIKIVRPLERGVIERLGKYHKFAKSGFNWIIPIIDRMIQVNITERMAGISRQEIITEDKLNAEVDLVVFYKVKSDEESVKSSLYNVADFEKQIITLAQTTARNVIGEMEFKDVNSKRKILNQKLAEILSKETKAWGVEIVRVELREIIPPRDVQDTMNKVIKAENEKRSAIDFATAQETQADGIKRAKIKEAEGLRQFAILEAEGKSKAFELINKSFIGNAKELKKLEVTQASLEKNSKIIISDKGINPQLIIGEIPLK